MCNYYDVDMSKRRAAADTAPRRQSIIQRRSLTNALPVGSLHHPASNHQQQQQQLPVAETYKVWMV